MGKMYIIELSGQQIEYLSICIQNMLNDLNLLVIENGFSIKKDDLKCLDEYLKNIKNTQ